MQISFNMIRIWATWFFFQNVDFSTIIQVDIFLVLLVAWYCLWLLPRGTVVICFCIICFKIMFFIVFIVLSSSSSPQIQDLDSQSIPQLNSSGIFFHFMFSSYCALKWKNSGFGYINEKNDLWNFHFSWVDIKASAHICETSRTLINEEFSLDFKNVCSCLVVNGKVLPQMTWWHNFIHIWSHRWLQTLILNVCILGGCLIACEIHWHVLSSYIIRTLSRIFVTDLILVTLVKPPQWLEDIQFKS